MLEYAATIEPKSKPTAVKKLGACLYAQTFVFFSQLLWHLMALTADRCTHNATRTHTQPVTAYQSIFPG